MLVNEIQHAHGPRAYTMPSTIPSQEDLSLNPEIGSRTEIADYVTRHLSRATVSPSNISAASPRQEVSENRDSRSIPVPVLQKISPYLSAHSTVPILNPRPHTLLVWDKYEYCISTD